jgi:hypothetical protein
VAGGEDELEEIIADIVIKGGVGVRAVFGFDLKVIGECIELAACHLVAAEIIEAAALGGGHEPRARIVGNARHRPLVESHQQGILRQLFGETNIADEPREPRDKTRGFDAIDGLDGAVGFSTGHAAKRANPNGRRKASRSVRWSGRHRLLVRGAPFGLFPQMRLGDAVDRKVQGFVSFAQFDLHPLLEGNPLQPG